MNFKLTITRTKVNNEIIEIFKVSPFNQFIRDNKRFIYHLHKVVIGFSSCHKEGLLLKEIIDNEDETLIYKYEFQNIKLKQSETIKLNYLPAPSKKCKFCIYEKIGVCTMRGTLITKYSHYKCIYWQELNYLRWKDSNGEKELYDSGRSRKNIPTHLKIPKRN